MPDQIKCPNCGHSFDVENVLAADLEQKYRQQYSQKLNESLTRVEEDKRKLLADQQQFEEKKKKENEIFSQRLQQEKIKLESELQEQLRKSIAGDYETQLRLLQTSNADNEEKLRAARQKELDFLRKEAMLKQKEEELEISLQKKLQEERNNLSVEIRRQEHEKNELKETAYQLKLQEMQKQLDDQKKLAEEMRRKAEQGSMQLQGEAQEMMLEKLLKEIFPFDLVDEVGTGVLGADCIQTIKNSSGKDCGKIIYESKRTKSWNNDWIHKLKADMRNKGADIAILVTQVYPKDMDRFGEREGIWICSFNEVASVSAIIRSGIIKTADILKSQENKGGKMQLLYDYLTGIEFRGQVEAIAEGFTAMKNSITKERMQMEKMWKEREKQLEKVLLGTSGLYGSVKGIAGASVGDIPLLDGDLTMLE